MGGLSGECYYPHKHTEALENDLNLGLENKKVKGRKGDIVTITIKAILFNYK